MYGINNIFIYLAYINMVVTEYNEMELQINSDLFLSFLKIYCCTVFKNPVND